ncbi:MAG: PEP-CTERM sorting domain-containing protein [Planctomycetaceae bacterium]|nr:PEP-CTERM sorting domain-containing protein [Planctomycetaceae bacterium]
MIRTTLIGMLAVLPVGSLPADVITIVAGQQGGEIRDTSNTLLGTWSYTFTPDHAGFNQSPSFANGGGSDNGGQLEFGSAPRSGTEDVMSFQLEITPEDGFVLDHVVINQSTFNSRPAVHNGPGGVGARDDKGTLADPVGQVWAVEGYSGAFTADLGTGGGADDDLSQITAPVVTMGNLTWQYVDDRITNAEDNWSVTLTDVDAGFDHVIRMSAPLELLNEWVSFNTQFSVAPTAVPEPGTWAGGLMVLGGMALRRRRSAAAVD